MYLFHIFVAGALLVCSTFAQGIAFTDWPQVAVAGNSYDIRWSGGDGSAVTITLLAGPISNLQIVSMLTTSGANNLFTWNVPSTIPNGPNFALGIQDSSDQNYIGGITLTGGTGSLSISNMPAGSPVTSSVPVVNATPSARLQTAVSIGTAAPVLNVTTFCPTATPPAQNVPTAAGPNSTPSIFPPIQNTAGKLASPAGIFGVWMLIFLHFA